MKEKKIPIAVFVKDHTYLSKLRNKMRKDSLAAVIESIVALLKHHKLEGELK